MTLLWIYAVFTVGVSFCCSLLEAALLSIQTASLTDESGETKSLGAKRLLDIKTSRLDDALSAILIVNTVANTLGAVLVGSEARSWARATFGAGEIEFVVGLTSVVLTLVILTFSEIVPKTLGAAYARPLSSLVGHSLFALTFGMAPILVLTRALTRWLTRGERQTISRSELTAFIETARRDGILETLEARLYGRLLQFRRVRVSDVMTPRSVAVTVPESLTAGEFLERRECGIYSRVPVYRKDRDDIVGYVLQKDILRALAKGASPDKLVGSFMRSVWYLPELVSVIDALKQSLSRREALAMVTDEHGTITGLVTREDLIETLLGTEILDESDRVADLRQIAAKIRDQRLREREKRQELI
ncbi:MAG: DUF21 domain-containing protein [Planctomycetes bacterium]|nr:DUF21 domain-containing protein [Planctomycetota bacterium]